MRAAGYIYDAFDACGGKRMAGPIVFVTTNKVRPGKLALLKEFIRERARAIEAEKPDTFAFLAYLNEEETEVTLIQVFPDAAAFDRHLEGVGERSKNAAEFLEFTRREVYGTPSDRTLATMKGSADSGISVRLVPELLGGYLRLPPS